MRREIWKYSSQFTHSTNFSLTLWVCVFCAVLLLSYFPIFISCWFRFSHCWFYKWPKMDTILNPMGLHTNVHEQNVTWWNKKKKLYKLQDIHYTMVTYSIKNRIMHFFVCLFVMHLVFLNACHVCVYVQCMFVISGFVNSFYICHSIFPVVVDHGFGSVFLFGFQ